MREELMKSLIRGLEHDERIKLLEILIVMMPEEELLTVLSDKLTMLQIDELNNRLP